MQNSKQLLACHHLHADDRPSELRLRHAGTTPELRDVWEETGFRLERLQAAEATVAEEQSGLAARTAPQWRLPFTPEWTPPEKLAAQNKVPRRLSSAPAAPDVRAILLGGTRPTAAASKAHDAGVKLTLQQQDVHRRLESCTLLVSVCHVQAVLSNLHWHCRVCRCGWRC